MRKLGLSKILALVLCLVILSSFVPTMTFATQSITLNSHKVIPGGAGVGYVDNPTAGGTKRDIETSGESVILRLNEWLKYDLSSLDAGTYQVTCVTANTGNPKITMSINDKAVFSNKTIKATASYSTFEEYAFGEVELAAGEKILKLENTTTSAVYIKEIKLVSKALLEKKAAMMKTSRPYKMSYLPCIVQAENFDAGVSGVAYFDKDINNTGGQYRIDNPVDIYKEDSVYYVNMVTDEWMTYTIKCKKSGNYDLIMNMVDKMEGSKVRIFMDGYEILKEVPEAAIPIDEMREIKAGTFFIEEGVHTLRVKCMEGDVNLDYMRFRDTDAEGIDISDTTLLRAWEDSQELDAEEEVEPVINPVERELYVDASKASNGDGSENSPFNSLTAARDYVRTINKDMKGDIVVNLKGEFKLDETFVLTEEDSGSDIYNVIYRGDGDASIHGGRKVTGWKQAEGSPLWQTTIPDVENFRQLYIGENRGIRSRSKYYYSMKAEYDIPGVDYNSPDGYIIDGANFPGGFSKPEDMEMLWFPTWRCVIMPIENITKMETGDYLVTYPQPYFETAFPSSGCPVTLKHCFLLENAPEFLDEPGEYYFDRDTKVLTYYPFSYEDMNTIDCYIPETEFLVKVAGKDGENKVKNITFEGLEFKYGAWERTTTKGYSTLQADQLYAPEADTGYMLVPAQVQVDFAQNVNFYKNEFVHLGSNALSINNQTNLCLVEGNTFDDISGTTITLGDWNLQLTDSLEKYTRKITVKNNLIRRSGVEYMNPLIAGYYVNKVLIDHNDIQDAPYSSITMGWGWGREYVYSAYNKITNNKFENGTYRLVDGGHIYTLSENKGGVVSGNYIKEAYDWKGAIYLDASTESITYFNNVIEDCPRWLKLTHKSVMNNTAYNNYSDSATCNLFPDQNDIEDAKGKVNGEWPDEAKEIINNAGLEDDYKYLLENYNARENLRNGSVERPELYRDIDGVYINGGDIMEGGEGVAYHDLASNANGHQLQPGQPHVLYSGDGAGITKVMVTVEGEWTKHEFTIDEAGQYDIIPYLGVVNPETAVTIEVDDVVVADKVKLEPNCTDYETMTPFNVATVNLSEGKHTIKIVHAVKNFGFKGILIEKTGSTGKPGGPGDGYKQELMDVVISK